MAHLINLKTYNDTRGSLIVIEQEIGFAIKRIYYIFNVPNQDVVRAGHGHIKNKQPLIAINGSCNIDLKDTGFILNNPNECLVLEPHDWHTLNNFSLDCILLVLASELYNINDYIDDPSKCI